jgi:hypothetical protein
VVDSLVLWESSLGAREDLKRFFQKASREKLKCMMMVLAGVTGMTIESRDESCF